MSTNRKNVINKAPLSNFTHNLEYRQIIVDSKTYLAMCSKISAIMKDVNLAIQELSLNICDRQIPFISGVTTMYNPNNNIADARIVLLGHTESTTTNLTKAKDRPDISHLIEFQLSAFYNQVTFSNSIFDAKLVIDEQFLATATMDLFLDLAMFNSYSFLRNMSIDEKKVFSQQKFNYFKSHNLRCYYTYDKTDTLLYYSLAFSARKDAKIIDFQEYITLWNDFLDIYYPSRVHVEESLELQIKKHVDHGHLANNKILEKMERYPNGAYLFIKVNKQPRTKKRVAQMGTLFGTEIPTLGDWKIIPMNQYYQIEDLAKNLYISVFKLIKV